MSNNVGPVGIAVVGCGNISDQYLANLVRFPDVAVLACADLDRDRAATQAAKYGIPHSGDLATVLAMPEVELIVNLTVPAVHASVALQAIRAGKHVYGEKPFALSVQEAQTVTAAATECGVQLGNAPDTFLGAGLQTARRLIEEGRIGTPISAKATFSYPGPDAWHPSPEFLFQQGGGPLLDMGPYYLTALVQMLGPVKTVSGFSSRAAGQAHHRQRPTRRRDLRRHRRHPGLGTAGVRLRPDRHRDIQLRRSDRLPRAGGPRHRSCHPFTGSELLRRVGVPVQEGREQG